MNVEVLFHHICDAYIQSTVYTRVHGVVIHFKYNNSETIGIQEMLSNYYE